MKRFFIATILLLASNICFAQTSDIATEEEATAQTATTFDPLTHAEDLWKQGNDAYIAGHYKEALEAYEAIMCEGLYSVQLYYNAANAYFKSENIGRAILCYHRALKLDPSFEDARHNLTIAEGATKDKIAAVPEFFLKGWIRAIRNSLSGTVWTVLSLIFLAVALSLVTLFLLSKVLTARKVAFYGVLVAALIFVVTSAFALSERNDALNRDEAIILSSAISVKSSPDRSATDLFVLHEGTKLKILTEVDSWCEIVIADGKKGWIEMKNIEKI